MRPSRSVMGWPAMLTLCGLFSLTSASKKVPTTTKIQSDPFTGALTADLPSSTPPILSGTPGPCHLDNTICCGPSTVSQATDLQRLAGCSTFQGNLVLHQIAAPTSSAQSSLPSLVIPVKEVLDGGLAVSGVHGQNGAGFEVSMDGVTSVDGDIAFVNMTNLRMPQFSSLRSAENIIFEDIKFHGFATFTTKDTVSLDANGTLPLTVQGITFARTNVVSIEPYNLNGEAPVAIDIQDNAQCTHVNLSTLTVVKPGTIKSNSLLKSLNLASMATTTDLEIEDNGSLTDLPFPSLRMVDGTLTVTDNGILKSVSFPVLSDVGVALTLKGPIDNFNVSPSFDEVSATIVIVSSGTLNCTALELPVRDNVHCTSGSTPASASGSTSPSSSSATSSGSSRHRDNSGLSTDARVGIGVGVSVGGALILALAVTLCLRSRHKSSPAPRTGSGEHAGYGGESDYYTYHEVPWELGSINQTRKEPHSEVHTAPSLEGMGDGWVPPEPSVPTTEGRTELEEQQGQRHEMDARSIDFREDDEGAETRSLEDIERVHRK